MTAAATDIDALRAGVTLEFSRRKLRSIGVPAAILVYLVTIFFAFDVPGLASRARVDNAAILLDDFWSFKTHVTKSNRSGELAIAIEGERKGEYAPGTAPDWVSLGETVRIALPDGGEARYLPDGRVELDVPDYGEIRVALDGGACWPSSRTA